MWGFSCFTSNNLNTLQICKFPDAAQVDMPSLLYLLVSPVILLISIPLTVFAAFTTTVAFSTLLFRVLLVYAELAAALLQDHFNPSTPSKTTLPLSRPPTTEDKVGRRKSRRSSAASGSSNGSTTPKAPKSSGFGVYTGEGSARDFEGVGGWRIPGPDGEDDELWTSMNSRLELPAMVEGRQRNHHRSRTSGSLNSSRLPSKSARAWSPHDRSASPEEYFTNRRSSKSTTALDAANIGKGLLQHKPSSSSSGSSGSTRTLHLTLSNT